MKQHAKKIFYLVMILLGLFLIFFFGKESIPETKDNKRLVVSNGPEYFKKGLDVAGGTRLIYTIDYSQYKDVYSDPAQFQQVKSNIETIIKKNIDARVNKLGVSEYNSYYQIADDSYFLVIEIGGISDLDQAKNTIGKTLELEFKLPNDETPSAEYIAQRKVLAKELLNTVINQPTKFKELTNAKGSENIYYNSYSGVSLTQLPEIYRNHTDVLENLELNTIYPGLIEDVYTAIPAQGTGEDTVLKGFTFLRILDKTTTEKTQLTPQDLLALADQYKLSDTIAFVKNPSIALNNYSYDASAKTLSYFVANTELDTAHKLSIYEIAQAPQFGLTGDALTQVQSGQKNTIAQAKEMVVAGKDPTSLSGVVLVVDNRVDLATVQQTLPDYKGQEVGTAEVFSHANGTWIIKAQDIKTEKDTLAQMIVLENLDQVAWDKIQSDMKSTTLYTIEDVFVQDRQLWTPAIDTKNNTILNGAYFQYANSDISQTGQPVVVINFDEKGKELFCNITKNNIGTPMAIFAGGNMLTSPVIQSDICGGKAEISGSFDSEGAKQLVEQLNEWTMPATLVLMHEEKISPTLGEHALTSAMWAGLIGTLLIIVIIRLMYGIKKAMITAIVLGSFIISLLGLMKLINYPLSLSGMAAIILSIGMGVDANILIYERIREELRAGKTMKSAILTGYERSLPAIRDGNLSTLIIAALLFILGINMFKGFGLMMMLNIVLTLAVNLPITKILLLMAYHRKSDYLQKSVVDKNVG